MPRHGAVVLLILCAAALLVGRAAHAEFYRWTDSSGQLRISNIPPAGVARDGSIAPFYSPSSIAAQQAALRARLKARDDALQAASHAAHSGADAAGETAAFDTARSK